MRKLNYIHFIFCLICIPVINYAKNNAGSVRGKILDEKNNPVAFVNLVLKNASDSSFVKAELSNEQGEFLFDLVKNGNYFVDVLGTGFEKYSSAPFGIKEGETGITLATIILKPLAQKLETVNVISDRPFIEKQIDKTVVNVESSILLAGSSILDLMEKLPGVMVNQDGAVSLRGKQGVMITIDGKPTGLSGQDLGNLLKGMPSSGILKVEIITNPSSKYDAAGSAGIINIVTKKNKRQGLNGNVSAGYGQGRYEKTNASLNLGYRNAKYNLLFSYSFSHRKGFNNLMLTRNFYDSSILNTVFSTDNYIVFPFNTHTPRLSVDFYLSQKTTLSVLGTGVVNLFNPYADNHTDLLDGNQVKTGSYDFTNRSTDKFFNYAANVQLKHDFDTNGTVLTTDLDYANYWNNTDNVFATTSYNANGDFLSRSLLVGDQDGALSIYSIKSDFSKSFIKRKIRLDAGIKSSYVKSDNDIKFYNQFENVNYFDSLRSNHFIYEENINATYLSLNKEYKKLSLQGGLRVEHTIANGNQLITGQKFSRNYAQIFPSVFADYKINKNHGLNLSAGRRIDRPAYGQMNPFRRLIDATTFAEGNPYLLPQLTWNTEFTYSYKNSLFASIGYSITSDNILDVLIQDSQTKTTIQGLVNLYRFNYYNASLTYSKKIKKWWTTNTNLVVYYGLYSGTINNYTINQGTPAFSITTSNSFFIRDGLSAELSFNYNHKNLYGVTLMRPNYSLSAGIQKSLFKKRATLTLNISDILWKAWPSGITHFGNVDEFWYSRRETRVANVNFTWRFGKGQTGKIRKNTGADDEKKRTG
jgi:hypothetical protein